MYKAFVYRAHLHKRSVASLFIFALGSPETVWSTSATQLLKALIIYAPASMYVWRPLDLCLLRKNVQILCRPFSLIQLEFKCQIRINQVRDYKLYR